MDQSTSQTSILICCKVSFKNILHYSFLWLHLQRYFPIITLNYFDVMSIDNISYIIHTAVADLYRIMIENFVHFAEY